jgi:hypothetical protein
MQKGISDMATVTGENGDHSEGIALSSLEVAALPWGASF